MVFRRVSRRHFPLSALLLVAVPLAALPAPNLFGSTPGVGVAMRLGGPLLAAGPEAAPGADAYREGQRALDDGRYDLAADHFARAAAAGGDAADAALYWQAYAEHRQKKDRQALQTLEKLTAAHPKSAWLDDAKALTVEIHGPKNDKGSSGKASTSSEDEELKLYALNALMNVEPERALPLLRKVLQGGSSLKVREQALFVLSQHDSADAAKLLAEVARGNSQPDLQRRALEYLGMSDTPESIRLLEEIYRASPSREVKRQILDAFMIADEDARILALATSEKDPELRSKAIETLGVMDQTAALRTLFRSETDSRVKSKIVEALAIADDAEFLTEAAKDPDPQIRRKAIEGIGMADGPQTSTLLRRLYKEGDRETRRAVLDAFLMQDDAAGLIEVAKSETDRELRRDALDRLSHMDSDAAQAFLLKALE